jgi:hypothetical protein
MVFDLELLDFSVWDHNLLYTYNKDGYYNIL